MDKATKYNTIKMSGNWDTCPYITHFVPNTSVPLQQLEHASSYYSFNIKQQETHCSSVIVDNLFNILTTFGNFDTL